MPPLCKGRGTALRWRDCVSTATRFDKTVFSFFYNPSVSSADSSLYTREPNGRDGLGEGTFRTGGPLAVEGVFIASLLREVSRLAATEGVFLSVVSLALSFSSLTPSVAYGASSLEREPFGTGDRALGREPFPALQARRRPVAWRAGMRFCFVPAPFFACRGFDPLCSRFSGKTPKQKAGPFRNGPAFCPVLL